MKKLYYIHDPMCSWCWGFNSTWNDVEAALKGKLEIEYIVGGLAPDSDQAMPEEMQLMLQNIWQSIQEKIPRTRFNFDFWSQCKPRRSTYPACRAVLAAKLQNAEKDMTLAIQQAYYLDAKNPSDNRTLEALSVVIGLNAEVFSQDLHSSKIQNQLLEQLEFGRSIGAHGFPSLILKTQTEYRRISIDYNSAYKIRRQLEL
jgi:putative protein-disulfide isomerase